MKSVLLRTGNVFSKGPLVVNPLKPLMGDHTIFAANGSEWAHQFREVMPILKSSEVHGEKMQKAMTEGVQYIVARMQDKLQDYPFAQLCAIRVKKGTGYGLFFTEQI